EVEVGVVVGRREMLGDALLEPFDDLLQRLLRRLYQQAVAALEDVLLGELLLQFGGEVEEVVLLVEQALGAGTARHRPAAVRLVEPAQTRVVHARRRSPALRDRRWWSLEGRGRRRAVASLRLPVDPLPLDHLADLERIEHHGRRRWRCALYGRWSLRLDGRRRRSRDRRRSGLRGGRRRRGG